MKHALLFLEGKAISNCPNIIVAGYGSWAKAAVNPASEVLSEIKNYSNADCNIIVVEMPVESAALYEKVEKLLLNEKPDAWIGLGVAAGSPVMKAEMVGINWRHFSVPDISGKTVSAEPVIKDGPVAYASDLPNEIIVQNWREANIPASISFHAGTHLCNQMIYTVRHLVELHGLSLTSGFLHLPQSTDNVALIEDLDKMTSSMTLSMMAEAVAIAVDCVARDVSNLSKLAV